MGVSEGVLLVCVFPLASFLQAWVPVYFFHPICAWEALLACSLSLQEWNGTYLNLQEILRNPINLLEALRVRVCACAREARRHELLRLALALLLLLGLRLLRLLLLLGWGVGLLRRFGAGVDALHFEEVCAIL